MVLIDIGLIASSVNISYVSALTPSLTPFRRMFQISWVFNSVITIDSAKYVVAGESQIGSCNMVLVGTSALSKGSTLTARNLSIETTSYDGAGSVDPTYPVLSLLLIAVDLVNNSYVSLSSSRSSFVVETGPSFRSYVFTSAMFANHTSSGVRQQCTYSTCALHIAVWLQQP